MPNTGIVKGKNLLSYKMSKDDVNFENFIKFNGSRNARISNNGIMSEDF